MTTTPRRLYVVRDSGTRPAPIPAPEVAEAPAPAPSWRTRAAAALARAHRPIRHMITAPVVAAVILAALAGAALVILAGSLTITPTPTAAGPAPTECALFCSPSAQASATEDTAEADHADGDTKGCVMFCTTTAAAHIDVSAAAPLPITIRL